MTAQQIELLKLGIAPIDDRAVIIIESGLEWVQRNTTLEFDKENDGKRQITAKLEYDRAEMNLD